MKMGAFLDQYHFIKCFPPTEDSCVLTVGYDDFHVIKPLFTFRVQNHYTWHFVLSGGGTLEMGGKMYPIKGGQMFFIPPEEQMRYYPDPEAPWEYVWFSLKGEAAREYGRLLGFSLEEPVRPCGHFSKTELALKKLFTSLTENDGGYFSVLSSFYEIMEICTSHTSGTGIDNVKKLIDESFTLPTFNIDQLCGDVGISHAHLLRLFKKNYGTTIIKYLLKKRVGYACELLVNTDIPIRSVAYSCGFSDEIHFMKTFKKEMGMSALAYRKTGGYRF